MRTAESKPQIELLRIGKKTFRVPHISGSETHSHAQHIDEKQQPAQQTVWRNTEASQKMIENDIRSKKNQIVSKKSESNSQWDSQWGGDARPMKAEEIVASIDTGDFSHFVSIPLCGDDKLMKKLNDFKSKVEEIFGQKYASNLIRDMRTAHVTLLMLKLNTPERKKRAIECIKNCEDILRVLLGGIQTFNLKGLGWFGKNEKQATTVYAAIDDPAFINFCNEATNVIVKEFIDFGLLSEDDFTHMRKDAEGKYNPEKLHISLLKANHSKSKQQATVGFDATEILDTFKHFEFANVKLSTIDISTRGQFVQSKGGYLPLSSFSTSI